MIYLIDGPPSIGKTTVAKALAKKLDARYYKYKPVEENDHTKLFTLRNWDFFSSDSFRSHTNYVLEWNLLEMIQEKQIDSIQLAYLLTRMKFEYCAVNLCMYTSNTVWYTDQVDGDESKLAMNDYMIDLSRSVLPIGDRSIPIYHRFYDVEAGNFPDEEQVTAWM